MQGAHQAIMMIIINQREKVVPEEEADITPVVLDMESPEGEGRRRKGIVRFYEYEHVEMANILLG